MSDSQIKVAIKVRPLLKRELDENLTLQWEISGNSIIATDSEYKKRGDGGFFFDHIFDQDSSNNDIFKEIVQPIIDAAVKGFNGTVFAYGQTSSGKTYTMMGTSKEPGIIPLTVEYLFDAIEQTIGREYLLRVSYLEIYNEKVKDLLVKNKNEDLKIHEDPQGHVFVNCKEEVTNCPETVLEIMRKGEKYRRVGETNMNEHSSRSHTIFRITIESRESGADSDCAVQVSQLNLVDLAGSERTRLTGATGERLKEGCYINTSLHNLGLVINQLSEQQDKSKFINFRNSKLTRLLQASLGGNAMTSIICTMTPVAFEESSCTLAFASRAQSIKNKPQVNEVMSDAALLKRYSKQIEKLNTELQKSKQQTQEQVQEKDENIKTLQKRIQLLETRIISSHSATEKDSFQIKSIRRRTWGGPNMTPNRYSIFINKALDTLETIEETSPQKCSNYENMIKDQSFQTKLEDFEVDLIESENQRINDSDDEISLPSTITRRRVYFVDNTNSKINDNRYISPERKNTAVQINSPGTPKIELRNRLSHLQKEFNELQEYTVLEKQILNEKPCNHEDDLKCMSELKIQIEKIKSEKIENEKRLQEECKDLTRKTTELQTQLQNIKSERDEYERISNQLRQDVTKVREELQSEVIKVTLEKENYETIASELKEELSKLKINNQQANDNVKDLQSYIAELESNKKNLEEENKELKSKIPIAVEENKNYEQYKKEISEMKATIEALEEDNANLQKKLDLENSKSEEIRADVESFSASVKELEQSVILLTKENTDLSNLLQEKTNEFKIAEDDYKKNIQELQTQISKIKEESKVNQLEQENLEIKDEENNKILESEESIHDLKVENSNVSLPHECEYKIKFKSLKENNEQLNKENIELSSDLMEKIEENDSLKSENEMLRTKVESMSLNLESNEIEIKLKKIEDENEHLKREIIKVKEENSGNNNPRLSELLQYNINHLDKSMDDTFSLPIYCDESKQIASPASSNEHSFSQLKKHDLNQSEICTNCTYHEELNVSRKLLQDDMKELSRRIEDSEKHLQRTYAETQALRMKAIEGLNVSADETCNSSFVDLNNSALEVKALQEELETLKTSNEQFINLCDEKSGEVEKLKIENLSESTNLTYSTPVKEKFSKRQAKISKLEQDIGQLNLDFCNIAKQVSKIQARLTKYITYKEKHSGEMQVLKETNRDLQEQMSKSEKTVKEHYDLIAELRDLIKFGKEISNNRIEYDDDQTILDELRLIISSLYTEICSLRDKLELEKEDSVETNTENTRASENSENVNKTNISILVTDPNRVIEVSFTNESSLNEDDGKNIIDSQRTVTELCEEIAELKHKLELAELNNELTINRATTCEISQREIQEESDKLSKELSDFIQENSTLKTKVATLEKAIKEKTLTKEEDDAKIVQNLLDLSIEAFHADCKDVVALRSSLEGLEKERSELLYIKENFEQKFISELKTVKLRFEDNIAQLQNKLKILNDNLIEYEEENNYLRIKIDKLENAVESKESIITTHEENVQQLHNELKLLNETSAKYVTENNRLTEEILKLQKLIDVNHEKEKSVVFEYEVNIKKLQDEINVLNESLSKYAEESNKLKEEMESLQKRNDEKQEEAQEKNQILELNEQHESVRKCIINEIISLKSKESNLNLETLKSKSINDLMKIFVQEIMAKHKELAKYWQKQINDIKEQSADNVKKATQWSKELEIEVDKLQGLLTQQEKVSENLQEKISQLEYTLKEVTHEKTVLLERLEDLDRENNVLQTELEKQSKVDIQQIEVISAAQKVDIENREMESQLKLKFMKEENDRKVEELTSTIEAYKTKIMECNNTIEGLEANELQLKNLIEIKSKELSYSQQCCQKLECELRQLNDSYNEVNADIVAKETRIREITEHLKIKCDLLSEYKNKLEIIMPEHDILKEQIVERTKCLEKYKTEVEALKVDTEKRTQIMEERINVLEINNAGLNKQITEINYKNISLMNDLESSAKKILDLEKMNEKLEKKVRNSTDKKKVEQEFEELKELNKILKTNLDGAGNCITELRESKIQLLNDYTSLKAKLDFVEQENKEINKMLSSYKSKKCDLDLEDKYDNLIQEKNKIAMALEEKKIILDSKNKEIQKYKSENESLIRKNKELDLEAEELANVITEINKENAILEDKFLTLSSKTSLNDTDEIKALREENQRLQLELKNSDKELSACKLEINKLYEKINSFGSLKMEYSDLIKRVKSSEGMDSSRGNISYSQKSDSPALVRRRNIRNEIFNQNRQLEIEDDEAFSYDLPDSPSELKKRLREQELEIVSQNGKIATLEVQIQSQSFPFQKKCKELQETLTRLQHKNMQLELEMKKLQSSVITSQSSVKSTKDKSTQSIPEVPRLRMCSSSSGIVEDHIRIEKLEKDKLTLKDCCRKRKQRIIELEGMLKLTETSNERESRVLQPINAVQEIKADRERVKNRPTFDKNIKEAMKENVPVNILENLLPLQSRPKTWNNY